MFTDELVDVAILALLKQDTWNLFGLPPEPFGSAQFQDVLRVLDERRLIEVHWRRTCGPNGPFDDRSPRHPELDVWSGPVGWYSPNRVPEGYRWAHIFKTYTPSSEDAPLLRLTQSARARAAELALLPQPLRSAQRHVQGSGESASSPVAASRGLRVWGSVRSIVATAYRIAVETWWKAFLDKFSPH